MGFQRYTNLTSPLDQYLALLAVRFVIAYFIHSILSPLVGNKNSFLKNLEQFIELIHEINLQNEDCPVSFYVSLFTIVPMEEVLQVIRNRLSMDPSFPECSPLEVEDIME
jgi:hypothetical protein